jgi:ketosteroid isomerase-like protein
MKIRPLVTLAGLIIGFAVPALAQEQNAVDPEARRNVEAAVLKFAEAYNKHDVASISALFTQDAVEIRAWATSLGGGAFSGRQDLEKMFAGDFATNPGKMVNKLVELYPIGNAVCEITDSSVGGRKSERVMIWVRDGDSWESSIGYVNKEQQIPVDPELRQQIEAVLMKFDEAYNKLDEAAIRALHTQDAVEVRSWGPAGRVRTGRKAIATEYAANSTSHTATLTTKIGQVYAIGNDVCAMIDWTVGQLRGSGARIFIRDGDTWKIRMAYLSLLQLP